MNQKQFSKKTSTQQNLSTLKSTNYAKKKCFSKTLSSSTKTKKTHFKKFDELKTLNEEQIGAFNEKWDAIVEDLTDESRKIENSLLDQHEAERQKFEEEMARQEAPGTKFSSDLLDKKFKFDQLLKNKRYATGKILKETIELMEEREIEDWERRFFLQKDKQRDLLSRKQKTEYDALKTRLEKSINSKLKLRMNEYDKLLQRVQNLQNELMTKQSLHFAKISVANSKLLSKYAVTSYEICDVFEGQFTRILFEGPTIL